MREHRQSRRFQCDEVLDCYIDDEIFEAEILDVSWGGVGIGCLQDLPLGGTLYLQHRDISRTQFPVKTSIRWKRPGVIHEYGLQFQEGTGTVAQRWVQDLFPEQSALRQEQAQKRVDVRVDVRLPIVTEDDYLEGETLDLSTSGARFRLNRPLKDQSNLLLCLPGSLLQVQAKVVRTQSEACHWVHSVQFQDKGLDESEILRSFVASVAST